MLATHFFEIDVRVLGSAIGVLFAMLLKVLVTLCEIDESAREHAVWGAGAGPWGAV